ncbi:prolyl oligopeptidase family serine peptidase [Sulfobacillus harzensis]|uniref:S9 family peptidase n=1 Tax=Sulfobacillus harzensis TaxID=2729629 RepID=A0A7Y0L3I4_9FIRM|nr:prolyl oligopeptidase family serine peptidase [Sulfobacillus harzensis]NMP21735.1 S9 family peptidase [Sulfobacillus harzensis]
MTYPKSEAKPVVEEIHGQAVIDPYRWLEDGHNAATRAWVAEQKAFTQSVMAQYPGRASIRARLAALRAMPDLGIPHGHGETIIFQRRDPGQEQAVLYAEYRGRQLTAADPNREGKGEPMHVDWADTSHDGRYVLYGLSRHGNEWSTLHIYDVVQERLLADRIPRARHSSIAFPAGSDGFYYTRYPDPGTVPPGDEHYHSRVFFHRLGTDYQNDAVIFQSPDDKRAMPGLHLSASGRYLAVSLHYGWSRTTLYLMDRTSGAEPQLIFDAGDVTLWPMWANDRLLALTNFEDDNGRIVEIDLNTFSHRTLVRGEDGAPFVDAVATPEHIYIHRLRQAASQLMVTNLDGTLQTEKSLPQGTSLGGLRTAHQAAYYGVSGFNMPPRIHVIFDRDLTETLWAEAAPSVDGIEVVQEWTTSRDGTRIPVYVARPRGFVQHGATPTVLSGYGGFDVANLPAYSPSVQAWVERGNVYALAILRGGSEFGKRWHEEGMRQHKQNVFDDFEAAAHHLIQTGYTDSEHLGVSGRSNGGLLAGAFITQNPRLAKAAIIGVPLLDMVRFHRFLIADLWTAEYGSPDIPEEFSWLYAYSPYHRVVPGTPYPATLLFTSEEDSRVDPMHARKMAALLQQASNSGLPVLLRVAEKTGHGVGKSVETWLEEEADIWTFLAYHLEGSNAE